MKNVLITGGAGFIGSHLVDRLLGENEWNVTVLDDFNSAYSPVLKYQNIAKHNENRSFSLFGGDIISEQVLDGVFSDHNFDCVIHLADKTGNTHFAGEASLLEKTNINGTLNLLEAARINGVKQFIFGSTASVYGNDLTTPFNEEIISKKSLSSYAAAKAVGETLCRTYSNLYDIRCVCLRFFTVYGPRQIPEMAVHKITSLIEAGRPVTFFGDGTTERDYVYISDVIDGIRAALNYDKSDFEIINLGTGRAVKLYDLVTMLETALKRKAVIKRTSYRSTEMYKTLADREKAKKLLDFEPKVSIEKGIENFVRWFREEKLADEYNDFVSEHNLVDFAV